MSEFVVIVPSRGRPEAARELIDAFELTCTAPDTHLLFAVDQSDKTAPLYADVAMGHDDISVGVGPATSMVGALNLAAAWFLCQEDRAAPTFAIGFMGDDHRPRTRGWDARYLEELHALGTGMVYGDDEFQGEKLPTQIAMTADIVRALRYMAPPALRHLYVDNFWLDLGQQLGKITYLPDVTIEHVHPVTGKTPMTEGHARVNSPEYYAHDQAAYFDFVRSGQLAADVEKVRAVMRGRRGPVSPQ